MTLEQENQEQDVAVVDPEVEVVPQEVAEKAPEETQEQINWRKVREAQEAARIQQAEIEAQAEKDRRETERLQTIIDGINNAKGGEKLSVAEQEQIIADLQDDDLPFGKDIKQYVAKYFKESISSILEDRDQKLREEQEEQRKRQRAQELKNRNPDLEDVLSKENMDYLDYHYPDVARGLKMIPDETEKWNSIYHTIKKLVPQSKPEERAMMQANANKPQAVSSGSHGSSDKEAYGTRSLTEAERNANYQRLLAQARQA